MHKQRSNTSTILPLGRPPPKAKSRVKHPLGNVSLSCKRESKCKCTSLKHQNQIMQGNYAMLAKEMNSTGNDILQPRIATLTWHQVMHLLTFYELHKQKSQNRQKEEKQQRRDHVHQRTTGTAQPRNTSFSKGAVYVIHCGFQSFLLEIRK